MMRLALALVLVVLTGITVEPFVTGAYWPNTTAMTWYLDPSTSDMDPRLAERDALSAAALWTAQTGGNFRMTYGGRVSGGSATKDGKSVVYFNPATNGSVVAQTNCYWTGLSFSECDITLWDGHARFFATDEVCGTYPNAGYLLDILAHEFGHMAGLLHSSVEGATMKAGYGYCETRWRTLEQDDIDGFLSLYPRVGTPPPPPNLTIISR